MPAAGGHGKIPHKSPLEIQAGFFVDLPEFPTTASAPVRCCANAN